MSTKITDNEPKKPCMSREHNPPMHLYIPPGQSVTHICPACGYTVQMHGGPVYL